MALYMLSCCDDDGILQPPINNCGYGLDEFLTTALEVEDSTYNGCGDTCVVDCEELYSDAIPFDYTEPCFNPNNAEQLAYFRYDNTSFNITSEIWVADFCSGTKKMIASNGFYGLDWGINDWLVYTSDDQNIWKIKSNGDSLTQLTFAGSYNRFPKWNPSGTKIALQHQSNSLSIFVITDENGIPLDTIEQLTSSGQWSWIDEDRICYMVAEPNTIPTVIHMNLYNIITGENKNLYTYVMENLSSLMKATSPNQARDKVFWCALGMIGEVNINTGEVKVLKKRLRQERYINLSVSPNGKEILLNKSVMHSVPHCKIDSEVDFYLIDIDGANTRKINLPE